MLNSIVYDVYGPSADICNIPLDRPDQPPTHGHR